jgi:hypothetical protein
VIIVRPSVCSNIAFQRKNPANNVPVEPQHKDRYLMHAIFGREMAYRSISATMGSPNHDPDIPILKQAKAECARLQYLEQSPA